jgi:hypothetical protein
MPTPTKGRKCNYQNILPFLKIPAQEFAVPKHVVWRGARRPRPFRPPPGVRGRPKKKSAVGAAFIAAVAAAVAGSAAGGTGRTRSPSWRRQQGGRLGGESRVIGLQIGLALVVPDITVNQRRAVSHVVKRT